LQRLVDQGFVLTILADDVVVYRLTPKQRLSDQLDPQQRVLVVEDDVVTGDLVVELLEEEGYAVIGAEALLDATQLLKQVSFDLVITDGFSRTPQLVLTTAGEVLKHAGTAPTLLFTAHQVELDEAKAAGFRDIVMKPFDLDALLEKIRLLLE
jgi:DNA-binding response OmpR family regulator